MDCRKRVLSFVSNRTTSYILLTGLIIRLAALFYGIIHDSYVDHIKYTDVDYKVFTNASQAIVDGRSPYLDPEYRYSPLVAILFVPNSLLNVNVGKFILIVMDILVGDLQYKLNIYQGTTRVNAKLFLFIWILNPVSIAISTRGSFEPILTFIILSAIYRLVEAKHIQAGLIHGLAIHLKMYPVIYSLALYGFLIQKKPYLKTQSKLIYWIKTLSPNLNHFKFFVATALSLMTTSYVSYSYFGKDYLHQSILYHLGRIDLQHNFSIYFWLFRKFPDRRDSLSSQAFILQAIGVIVISIAYISFETNRRTKLRKLHFSLFLSTFLFVSLNKVITSQYFTWYLIFVPLIVDNLKIDFPKAMCILFAWLGSQLNWLLFAYLYEYQGIEGALDKVGNACIVFLASNMLVMRTMIKSFDPSPSWQS